MFVGHIGMGLALKRAEPRLNLGVLLFCSLFLDFLLGVFVLSGVEKVIVPENFARLHYLLFQFPYSHSLVWVLFWSAGAACIGLLFLHGKDWRKRGAVVIGLAVFIHFVGDIIEHPPQLHVAGSHSTRLGLGLWDHLGWALALEVLLLVLGLWLYLSVTITHRVWKRRGVLILLSLLTAFAVAGQLTSENAPSPQVNAAVWIITPWILGAACWWLDSDSASLDRGWKQAV